MGAEKATETQKKESHVKKTREQKNKEVAEKKGKESAKKERGDKELKAKGEHKKHHEAAQKASEKWNKRSTSYVLKQCWEQDKKEVNRLNKAVTDTESKLSRLNNKRDHLKKQEMALQFSMENLAKEGIAMCKSLGSDGAIDKSGASDDVRAFLKTIGRTFCQQVSRSSSLKQWIKEKAEVDEAIPKEIGEITMSKKLVTQETEYLNKRSRKCCNTGLETVKGEWAIVKKNGARRAKESQLNMEVIKQLGGDPKQLKPIKEPVAPAVLTLEERLRKSGQKVCHAESTTPKSMTTSPTKAPTTHPPAFLPRHPLKIRGQASVACSLIKSKANNRAVTALAAPKVVALYHRRRVFLHGSVTRNPSGQRRRRPTPRVNRLRIG